MTHIIHAVNVNEALPLGLELLRDRGLFEHSRVGRVLVAPGPVVTEYAKPEQRVLFAPERDANPFFHLMESMWMLAGRNDVAFPASFAANIASFSDDGVTVAGAYGDRWLNRFGYDQLNVIIEELKANPSSRRCVLAMWDAAGQDHMVHGSSGSDLHLAMNGGKDVPCNTHIYFDTIGDARTLNMTVLNRSNDVVWGAYGANVVHFSFLLEYVARACGMFVGKYRQVSNNYHIYYDRPDVQRLIDKGWGIQVSNLDLYATDGVMPVPLYAFKQAFDEDMATFFIQWDSGIRVFETQEFVEPWWKYVVVPLMNAWQQHKGFKDYEAALQIASTITATDWRIACVHWLRTRQEKHNAKQ